jgi:hypothetical protein
MSEANGHREHLEHRAEEVRSKLERSLRLIDERRHRVVEVARSATRRPASIVLFSLAGAAAAIFIVQRVRGRRSTGERLLRLLEAPPPEKSAFAQNVQKAVTSLGVLAVQRLGRHALDHWLAEPGGAEPSDHHDYQQQSIGSEL